VTFIFGPTFILHVYVNHWWKCRYNILYRDTLHAGFLAFYSFRLLYLVFFKIIINIILREWLAEVINTTGILTDVRRLSVYELSGLKTALKSSHLTKPKKPLIFSWDRVQSTRRSAPKTYTKTYPVPVHFYWPLCPVVLTCKSMHANQTVDKYSNILSVKKTLSTSTYGTHMEQFTFLYILLMWLTSHKKIHCYFLNLYTNHHIID
jgi:hypothetical protein